MDRIDSIQAFVRVVETGSFTKAAQTLHLGKTTVTHLIQQLEARLRVKLLNRTTRKVQPTAESAAYYERVARLVNELEDADAAILQGSAASRGLVRVDAVSPLARLILIPSLAEFYERFPEISIHLGVSDRPVDLIGDQVDCVIRSGGIIDPSCIARHIADLKMGIYAARTYIEKAALPEHPQDLALARQHVPAFLSP